MTIKLMMYIAWQGFFSPSSLTTQMPPVVLAWQVPDECPQANEVMDQIVRLLSGSERSRFEPISASGTIQKLGTNRYQLKLRTIQASVKGQRLIEAQKCQALADSTALILALMLDPHSVVVPSDVKTDAHKEPEPSDPPQIIPEQKTPPPKPSIQSTWRSNLGLDGALIADWGTLPGITVGLSLGGHVLHKRLRLGLQALVLAPRMGEADYSTDLGGTLWLLGSSAQVGLRLWNDPIELGLYFQTELGAILAKGSGITIVRSGAAFWIALGGGLESFFTVSSNVKIRLQLGWLAPLTRTRFYIKDIGVVHELGPVSLRLVLGVDWLF